jgi:hypothetical protein
MAQIQRTHKLQFSGHETFPLRQLWLRKAYDAVSQSIELTSKTLFSDDDAIARFGVGKNMVSSMRFWASACQIIKEDDEHNAYVTTEIGDLLFDSQTGLDPYCENPATPWLMHWFLASTPEKTSTWYYVFNKIVQQNFDRDSVVEGIKNMALDNGQKISIATLKRDVDCCIRSYVPKAGGDSPEEMSEPLLGELGLIQQNAKGSFEFRRGAKRSLADGVFAFALLDYWQRLEHAGSVMAFDRVAHDYGSPGRVFKLDENTVADRLTALERLTEGKIQWTEQAGIRQVTRTGEALNNIQATKMKLLKAVYGKK